MKNWIIRTVLILGLFAVTAVGAYQCGRGAERDTSAPSISYGGSLQEEAAPESYDLSPRQNGWGRYRVQYYLKMKKNRAPWAVGNYYIYAFPVTIEWPKTPNQADIAAQVPVPSVFGDYQVCLNCPIGIEVLRPAVAPIEVIEAPEKPTKQ